MKQGSNIGEPLMGLEERSTSECQRPSNSEIAVASCDWCLFFTVAELSDVRWQQRDQADAW